MTREQAKKLLPIIQAYAEGKIVEFFSALDCEWHELTDPLFFDAPIEYRIKPKEDTEITSVEELKEAIFSNKKEFLSKGGYAELQKKACEKPTSCRFSKSGIELDKVENLLSELSKRGIFILAKEINAKLFADTDGKLRMKDMDCTIQFYEI